MSEGIARMDVISDGASNDYYVIGADWALCRTRSETSKRAQGSALSVAVEGDDGQVVSTLDKEFVSARPGRRAYLNALAVIAAVERNAVVFHELPGGMVWVAAVREGVPLPGCDRVTETAAAHELLGEYLTFVPNGIIIGTPVDAARSAETIFKNCDLRKRAACTYKRPKSTGLLLLKIVAVLVAIGVAVFAVQSIRVAREATERAGVAAMSRLNESARVDAVISQYNADVRRIIEQARAEIATTVPVGIQLLRWLEYATKHSLVQNGFRLETVSCDQSKCKFKWRALERADLSGPVAESIEARDDTSIVTVEVVEEGTRLPRVREERLALASRFHQHPGMLNVSFAVSPQLAAIMVPTPARPQVPAEMQAKLAGVQPVTVGHQAAVTLNAPLSLIHETVAMVGNSVTLKDFEAGPMTSATGGAVAPQIKLTGFYVRLP